MKDDIKICNECEKEKEWGELQGFSCHKGYETFICKDCVKVIIEKFKRKNE